jgi:hypothetical protein
MTKLTRMLFWVVTVVAALFPMVADNQTLVRDDL